MTQEQAEKVNVNSSLRIRLRGSARDSIQGLLSTLHVNGVQRELPVNRGLNTVIMDAEGTFKTARNFDLYADVNQWNQWALWVSEYSASGDIVAAASADALGTVVAPPGGLAEMLMELVGAQKPFELTGRTSYALLFIVGIKYCIEKAEPHRGQHALIVTDLSSFAEQASGSVPAGAGREPPVALDQDLFLTLRGSGYGASANGVAALYVDRQDLGLPQQRGLNTAILDAGGRVKFKENFDLYAGPGQWDRWAAWIEEHARQGDLVATAGHGELGATPVTRNSGAGALLARVKAEKVFAVSGRTAYALLFVKDLEGCLEEVGTSRGGHALINSDLSPFIRLGAPVDNRAVFAGAGGERTSNTPIRLQSGAWGSPEPTMLQVAGGDAGLPQLRGLNTSILTPGGTVKASASFDIYASVDQWTAWRDWVVAQAAAGDIVATGLADSFHPTPLSPDSPAGALLLEYGVREVFGLAGRRPYALLFVVGLRRCLEASAPANALYTQLDASLESLAQELVAGKAASRPSRKSCMQFNGVDQYLSTSIDISERDYTVSIWFKTSAVNTGLFSAQATSLTTEGADRLLYLAGGRVHASLSEADTIRSENSYADGRWHQVKHVFGGRVGGQRLYVDGALVAQGTKSFSNLTRQNAIAIGYCSRSEQPYFNGQIAQVCIWSRAQSELELQDPTRVETGSAKDLVLFYDFGAPRHSVVKDKSGQGHDGILHYGPAWTWADDFTGTFFPPIIPVKTAADEKARFTVDDIAVQSDLRVQITGSGYESRERVARLRVNGEDRKLPQRRGLNSCIMNASGTALFTASFDVFGDPGEWAQWVAWIEDKSRPGDIIATAGFDSLVNTEGVDPDSPIGAFFRKVGAGQIFLAQMRMAYALLFVKGIDRCVEVLETEKDQLALIDTRLQALVTKGGAPSANQTPIRLQSGVWGSPEPTMLQVAGGDAGLPQLRGLNTSILTVGGTVKTSASFDLYASVDQWTAWRDWVVAQAAAGDIVATGLADSFHPTPLSPDSPAGALLLEYGVREVFGLAGRRPYALLFVVGLRRCLEASAPAGTPSVRLDTSLENLGRELAAGNPGRKPVAQPAAPGSSAPSTSATPSSPPSATPSSPPSPPSATPQTPSPTTAPGSPAPAPQDSPLANAVIGRDMAPLVQGDNAVISLDLLGRYGVDLAWLKHLFTSAIRIEEAKGEFVRGELGAKVDENGMVLDTEETHYRLSGKVILFGKTEVEMTAYFYYSQGTPNATLHLKFPNVLLGTFAPIATPLNGLMLETPTVVITTRRLIVYDSGYDSGLTRGINFLTALPFAESGNLGLQWISRLLSIKKLAVHGAFGLGGKLDPFMLIEAGLQIDIPFIEAREIDMRFVRTDIGFEFSGEGPQLDLSVDLVVRPKFRQVAIEQFGSSGEIPEDPELIFTGGISLQWESITASLTFNGTGRNAAGELTGEKSGDAWEKPFGMPQVTFYQFALDLGFRYTPPYFDNFGLSCSATVGALTGTVAFSIDVDDLDMVLVMTLLGRVNLIEAMVSMFPIGYDHYDRLPGQTKQAIRDAVDISVRDPYVSIVPRATSIGGIHYENEGIQLAGEFDFYGLGGYMQAHFDYAVGVLFEARLNPIEWSPILRFSHLTLYFSMRFDRAPEWYFIGNFTMFGVTTRLTQALEGTRLPFAFSHDNPSAGTISLSGHCDLREMYVFASGRLELSIDDAIGLSLGTINALKTTFAAQVRAEGRVNGTFSCILNGSYEYRGKKITLPPLQLAIPPEDLRAFRDAVVQHIRATGEQFLAIFFMSPKEFADALGNGTLRAPANLFYICQAVLKTTAEETVQIYKTAGENAVDTANAIHNLHQKNMRETADLLKGNGFDEPGELIQALHKTFASVAENNVQALIAMYREQGLGFLVDIIQAQNPIFNTGIDETCKAMKAVGFDVDAVGNAAKTVFQLGNTALVASLKVAGFNGEQVGDFIVKSLDITDPGAMLANAKFLAEETGKFATNVANATAAAAQDVASWANTAYGDVKGKAEDFGKDVGGGLSTGVNETKKWIDSWTPW